MAVDGLELFGPLDIHVSRWFHGGLVLATVLGQPANPFGAEEQPFWAGYSTCSDRGKVFGEISRAEGQIPGADIKRVS